MSMHKRLRTLGMVMLISFFMLLAVIFSRVFPGGTNGLDYMDNLFNMISKGSSYFIPQVSAESEGYEGKIIEVSLNLADEEQMEKAARLFTGAGAEVKIVASQLTLKGEMSRILLASLSDANLLFHNKGRELAEKYGMNERQVLYIWWTASKSIISALNKQKNFKEAKTFATLQKKALEPAYNYYGVEASSYKDNLFMIVAALVFYVIYTLWYGFGIMYLFEGAGLKISH